MVLWLSQRLVKWKFFARHLQLKDHVIDRIEVDNPGDVREQCYNALHAWQQEMGKACSYQTLGKVILESERNRGLYTGFVEKLREAERASSD